MDNTKDYESSEFYSYKFKNFSTMIIIPATILVVLLIIGSFFAVRQNTVTSEGIIEPAKVLNVSGKYQEGQTVVRGKQKWLVHLDEKTGTAHLMPEINPKKVQVIVYFAGNKIAAIKKGQTVHMNIANASGTTDRLTGKVITVGTYPVSIHGNSAYEVTCRVKTNNRNIKYGMTGEASIITGKSSYFEYVKNKILDK